MRILLIMVLGYGKMLGMFLVGLMVIVSMLAVITKIKKDPMWLSRLIHNKVLN